MCFFYEGEELVGAKPEEREAWERTYLKNFARARGARGEDQGRARRLGQARLARQSPHSNADAPMLPPVEELWSGTPAFEWGD